MVSPGPALSPGRCVNREPLPSLKCLVAGGGNSGGKGGVRGGLYRALAVGAVAAGDSGMEGFMEKAPADRKEREDFRR